MSLQPTGLARVTVAAPRRRIDLALPEHAMVAEVLPSLLRHAGEELADDGVEHGGWLLRREDGSPLVLTRTLGSHRIRDGEVLHLVPRRQEWPELDYDDLVDAIASGSRRRTRSWTPRNTRQTGLAVGAVAILLAIVAVFRSGPDWVVAARWALGQALLLTLTGVVLARAAGDSAAGAVVGLLALPFAFVGGGLLLAHDGSLPIAGRVVSAPGLGAPQLEVACAALLVFGLLGYLGVGDHGALFAGAATAGLLGVLGAWLTAGRDMPPSHSAAILISAALPLSPLFGSLAIRLGRLPMPTLPRSPSDLLRDEAQPPRPAVYAAVARADGLLTGMLIGASAVAAVCEVVLIRTDSVAARILVGLAALGFLLRARLYPIIRQRVPVLFAGLVGVACLMLGPVMHDPTTRLVIAGPGLMALGALAVVFGLGYSRRKPTPYFGRYAEILEVLGILAVVPVACSVLGLYGHLRGLGG
jgi:type VII secretion integral membrane protein EccD